jgi:hypothetical protein
MLVAIVVGRFVANGRLALGVGVVVAVAYLLLVLFDLAAAIAGWAALLFIVHLAVLRSGPLGVQLLVVIAWVGAAGVHRGRAPVLAAYRRLPLAMVVLAVWLTLSIAWAERAGAAPQWGRAGWGGRGARGLRPATGGRPCSPS